MRAADWPTGKTKWPLEKEESCVRGLLSSSAAALIIPRSFTFNLSKRIANPVRHVSHAAQMNLMELLWVHCALEVFTVLSTNLH